MHYFKRSLEDQLLQHMNSPQALFILGPRQVGKTTLLKHLMELVGPGKSLYYDIELPQDLEVFYGVFDSILARLRLDRKDANARCWVFIDEVQYLEDLSKTIKLLVDHHPDEFKLVLTGSSSSLIKSQFSESLVGRMQEFTLYPLSYVEFCRFEGESGIAEQLEAGYAHRAENPIHSKRIMMKALQQKYMLFGGYPRVVLQDNMLSKAEILTDLVSSYILKDIRHIFRIEKPDQLNRLIRVLAASIGKEFNIQNLSQEVGLHRDTLQSYLMVLESSYIIHQIRPFFNNPGKELRKMPKVYFIDPGIRNSLLTDFRELLKRNDAGELFENMVFLNLLHKQNALSQIKYWKSKNYQEVDFVRIENASVTAYEVKLGKDRKNNFNSFLHLYPDARCYTVRFDYQYREDELPAWF